MRKEHASVYCLDCGTPIDESESQCANCGSLVSDMKERIARAEEMIVYTDAVNVTHTTKLPLVEKRTYKDKDGNPLDPAQEVHIDTDIPEVYDLSAIPEIGAGDPYITMPMQRIVSDKGEVVADVDHEAKVFLQPGEVSSRPVGKVVIVVVVVAVLVLCAYMALTQNILESVFG